MASHGPCGDSDNYEYIILYISKTLLRITLLDSLVLHIYSICINIYSVQCSQVNSVYSFFCIYS